MENETFPIPPEAIEPKVIEPQPELRAIALSKVQAPAIAMLVLWIISILYAVGGAIAQMVGVTFGTMQQMPEDMPNFVIQMQALTKNPAVIASSTFLSVGMGVVAIIGAIKMMKLQSYGLAMTAAVLTVIPCFGSCCCFIGIPIGIWAMVVLNKDYVKSQFA